MAGIIQPTSVIGRGVQIAAGGDGILGTNSVIPYHPPNPNDLSDIEQSNAALRDYCDCEVTTQDYGDLDVAAYPFARAAFLFRRQPIEQFMPASITNAGVCVRAPADGLTNTVKFHVVDHSITDLQVKQNKIDYSATHDRPEIRDFGKQNKIADSLDIRGYEHIFGDTPGYKSGKTITFESGRIALNLLNANIIKKKTLPVTPKTATTGERYTRIDGTSGMYIKEVVFNITALNAASCGKSHLLFKYNVEPNSECGPEQYRIHAILDHESIIDNIEIIPDSLGAVKVDCRYTTADHLELWGYQPKITSVDVYYIEAKDFFENVLIADSVATTFDSRGRLFCFYEEDINFTELPYEIFECKPSSSSSGPVTPPVTPPPPTEQPGGGGGGFGGGGGGGGGGNGGGGGGGGGIPGNGTTQIQYSSSSSAAPQPSSSSSSPPAVQPSSSSSGGPDIQPPSPPTNGVGQVGSGTDGSTSTVTTTWENGDIVPGNIGDGASNGDIDGDGQPDTDTQKYRIYRSTEPDSGFVQIGEVTTNSFTDPSPILNTWNYYRITAIDAAGNESGYILIEVFVTLPKPCVTRDCAGCEVTGYKSRNSFHVFFSDFDPRALTFKCESCDGVDGFVRLLPEAFWEKELTTLTIGMDTRTTVHTSEGDRIAKNFCLLPSCTDGVTSGSNTTYHACSWTNTFFVPALVYGCSGFGCGRGYEKILVPMTITVTQNKDTGWSMEVYAVSPDCKKMNIFKNVNVGTACSQPKRFINELTLDATSTNGALGISENPCGIFPPDAYKKTCGTISCAMSPDLGKTWFKYRGVINITNDRKAIKPFVTHDKRTDTIHLFYVDRQFINENSILYQQGYSTALSGKDAYLVHVGLKADDFVTEDAFKTYYPLPSSLDGPDFSNGTSSSSSSSLSAGQIYGAQQLAQFSVKGQALRRNKPTYILNEYTQGSDTDPKKKRISLIDEHNSAYIDRQGRLHVVRFGAANTLVDPPDRLTRRRRKQAKCGNYTWTVSGVTDKDCVCQSMLGSFNLELIEKYQEYRDEKWTLAPSEDYKYWEITSVSGMLTFRRKRDLTLCPPIGVYDLICNRCLGGIVGTLDVQKMGVYSDGVGIDSGDFNPSTRNNTDFGYVPSGTFKENEYVIKNQRPTPLKLTMPIIVGPNASQFTLTVPPLLNLQPNDQTVFSVKFTPTGDCTGSPQNLRTAQIRLQTPNGSAFASSSYYFNIQGRCGPAVQGLTAEVGNSYAPGVVFSADAVGSILRSLDGGNSWEPLEQAEGFKTGQWGTMVYDEQQNALYNVYVVDDMLFARRYPSIYYSTAADQQTDLDPAFDGSNIITPPELEIPNTDIFSGGLNTLGELGGAATIFSLPIIKIPGNVLDTFEEDLRSKKTPLKNEKDPGGLPVFLAGNRTGALINAIYPYKDGFVFNEKLAVGQAKPAAYIARDGKLRFFYVDSNGHVNAGALSGTVPILDTKLKKQPVITT